MVQVVDVLQENQISTSTVQKLFTPGPICYLALITVLNIAMISVSPL